MPGLRPLCFSMQPDVAPVAFRNRGLIRDYDDRPDAMLAEGPPEPRTDGQSALMTSAPKASSVAGEAKSANQT